MGLLYPFPVSADETDFVTLETSPQGSIARVELKSYGLPYIFWGYAAASLTVLFFLWLAVREPMSKLSAMGGLDATLVLCLQIFIAALPVVVLGFFFYEKILVTRGNELTVTQRVFRIPVSKKTYQLTGDGLSVNHHMDSPNVARMKGGPEAQGFQNKGYFTLWAHTTKGMIAIDRHSRKVDLEALSALLNLSAKNG